jgi:hypothetical protein
MSKNPFLFGKNAPAYIKGNVGHKGGQRGSEFSEILAKSTKMEVKPNV